MPHHWKKLLPLTLIIIAMVWAFKSANQPAPIPTPPTKQTPSLSTVTAPITKPQPLNKKWQALLDDNLTWQERLALADSIRAGISPAEVDFLFTALDHTPSPATQEAWWAVMNEIMERLRKQGLGADQYTARLSKIAADSQRPEVARDYAIQHLLQWISPIDSITTPSEPDPAIRAQTLVLVAGIIRDPSLRHSSISGTALLALADATSRLPSAEASACWDKLDVLLAPLAAGTSDASLTLHVSAIQAAALAGRTAHLPAIHRLAMDATANPSLRLTSIAALGLYGVEENRTSLTTLSHNNDRFSYAARAALARLDAQLARNAP